MFPATLHRRALISVAKTKTSLGGFGSHAICHFPRLHLNTLFLHITFCVTLDGDFDEGSFLTALNSAGY